MAGKPKNLCANKKGSASRTRTGRAEVGRGRPKGWKGCGARTGERSGADHFSGGFTAAQCMCVYVREFEQLNHRNFISVRRPRNITVRSVVVARDFGSGPAPPAQNFFHSLTASHPQESEETVSLIGREESSVDKWRCRKKRLLKDSLVNSVDTWLALLFQLEKWMI